MAKQQGGSQSRGSSRGTESNAGRSASGRNANQNTSTARTSASTSRQSGSTSGASGGQRTAASQPTAADQRADQERQLNVSREGAKAGASETTGGASMGTSTGASTAAATGASTAATKGAQAGRTGAANVSDRNTESSILPALMSNPWLMTNAFLSNPFGFARAMNQEMDRLISGIPADVGSYPQRGAAGGQEPRSLDVSRPQRGISQWSPQVEVRHNGNQLSVCADLPGLTAKDIDIQVEDGILTISGERQQSSEDKREGYYRSERSYGSFSRSVALPDGVNEGQIRAQFNNGVLEVTIPVPAQRQRGRRVEIQSGE
jgi:HSP20 family protein